MIWSVSIALIIYSLTHKDSKFTESAAGIAIGLIFSAVVISHL